jgi:hypothetical protein
VRGQEGKRVSKNSRKTEHRSTEAQKHRSTEVSTEGGTKGSTKGRKWKEVFVLPSSRRNKLLRQKSPGALFRFAKIIL